MNTKISLKHSIGIILLFLFISLPSFAQDIIKTKAGKDISAKVLEVSENEVSYKMYDNQDGPTFKITPDKLFKIIFENGSEYAFVEESTHHNLPQDASLAELTAPGNNVFIEFKDNSGTFEEKDEFIKNYIKELTEWNVVEIPENADFILYVEGYSKRTIKSFTSDTYFLTATIRRRDNSEVWTGETVDDYANAYNGYLAVKGVSKKLVEKSLLKELKKRNR